ncbi:MAG: hypothetical protein CSA96_04190 [Bacteroidetes bacterium]|nr:MAG: hypothetical protein CSA96_04190 [Bacteroidota bacterium]
MEKGSLRLETLSLKDEQMKIESRIGKSSQKDEAIYHFITDFRNFQDLIPQGRVSEWKASEDRCSFKVSPVGLIGLILVEKEAFKCVKLMSDPGIASYQFTIWIQLKQIAENNTRIKITIEPKVSQMMIPMLKGPLKQLADTLVTKMEGYHFPEP